MMTIRPVNKEAELILYKKEFVTHSMDKSNSLKTRELPMEYLRQNLVYAAFDSENAMLAGYILCHTQPLRLLDFVPKESLLQISLPANTTWNDFCEVTCAWKKPNVSSLYMSAFFWPHGMIEFLKTKRKYLLGHNQNVKLDTFYTKLGPLTLYQGLSNFGLNSRLFAYPRFMIFLSIFVFWFWETPYRFFRKGKNAPSPR